MHHQRSLAGLASARAKRRRQSASVRECHAAAQAAGIETHEGREWWIVNVARHKWDLSVIARVFGVSRQMVWKIVERARGREEAA